MRPSGKILVGFLLALTVVACQSSEPVDSVISGTLQKMADRAQKKEAWPALRQHAAAGQEAEERGLAYFLLGYREFEAGEYVAATDDLRKAAETHFSLSDHAEYYWATSAEAADQPQQAIEALDNFSFRHTDSPSRLEALALLARTLLKVGEPERAIMVLAAEPQTRQRPPLLLLLAQAYLQAVRLVEAATAFQEAYYAFPEAPQSQVAADALVVLRARLGARFPGPTEGIQNCPSRDSLPPRALPRGPS